MPVSDDDRRDHVFRQSGQARLGTTGLGVWPGLVVALWPDGRCRLAHLAVAATIRAFWPHNRLAAMLLLPYLGLVSFASALTWTIWQANPGLLT